MKVDDFRQAVGLIISELCPNAEVEDDLEFYAVYSAVKYNNGKITLSNGTTLSLNFYQAYRALQVEMNGESFLLSNDLLNAHYSSLVHYSQEVSYAIKMYSNRYTDPHSSYELVSRYTANMIGDLNLPNSEALLNLFLQVLENEEEPPLFHGTAYSVFKDSIRNNTFVVHELLGALRIDEPTDGVGFVECVPITRLAMVCSSQRLSPEDVVATSYRGVQLYQPLQNEDGENSERN